MRSASHLAALAAILLAACASTPDVPRPYLLVPASAEGRALDPALPVITEKPGVRLEVRSLTDAERSAWLRRRLEIDEDPLVKASMTNRFFTFQLIVRATGDEQLHLETQSIRLWPTSGDPSRAPLDYTRVYDLLRPDREHGPESGDVEAFMRGLYDGPVYVDPGQGRDGLLLIPKPPGDAETMILELPFVQVGPTTHRMRVPFIKRYLDEPEQRSDDK